MNEAAAKQSKPVWFDQALAVPSETAQIVVADCPIHYATWGEVGKPGIMLVHGSNAHRGWWQFVAPFLADQFRVVAFDLSGNGDSGWRERYTGEIFARETWAVCAAAGLGPKPYVVGHSFGGFVALETGHYFGQELGGIVLADFTVNPPDDYTEWGRQAEISGRSTPRATRIYDDLQTALGRFRLLPEQPCRHPYIIDHIARQSLRQVEGGWTWKFDPSLFEYLEMGRAQQEKFLNLTCPSALILGDQSTDDGAQSAPHMLELTAGLLPVINIPGTHHHFMFDEPMAVVAAIKGIVLNWIRQDRVDELEIALAKARSQYRQ